MSTNNNKKSLKQVQSNSTLLPHSELEDSLLEERIRIANFVLPEDNLEDLLRLPIAPELISRKLRQQQLIKQQQQQQQQLQLQLQQQHESDYQIKPNNHPNQTQNHERNLPSSSSSTLNPRSTNPKLSIPTISKSNPPKFPQAQRSFSSQTAAQRHRERSKSTANQLSMPSSTPKTRTILNEQHHHPHTLKDKSIPHPRTKSFKLRPRSMSASSLHDSTPGALPPWTTDPSPRIYRVDPANNNSPLNGSDFKPPSHDDLILPTVARQIEKQSKLLTPTDHPTFSSVSSNFSQWEALGPQLLLRKASLKRQEGSFAESSTLSIDEPLSSPVPEEELIEPLTPASARSKGAGNGVGTVDASRRLSRRMSSSQGHSQLGGSQGTGPSDDRRGSRRLSTYLSPASSARRGSQQSNSSQGSPSAARRVLGPAQASHQPLPSEDGSQEPSPPSPQRPGSPQLQPPPDLHHATSFPPPQSHPDQFEDDQLRQSDPDPQGCCKCIIV